jgi:hypothetical protein
MIEPCPINVVPITGTPIIIQSNKCSKKVACPAAQKNGKKGKK